MLSAEKDGVDHKEKDFLVFRLVIHYLSLDNMLECSIYKR